REETASCDGSTLRTLREGFQRVAPFLCHTPAVVPLIRVTPWGTSRNAALCPGRLPCRGDRHPGLHRRAPLGGLMAWTGSVSRPQPPLPSAMPTLGVAPPWFLLRRNQGRAGSRAP